MKAIAAWFNGDWWAMVEGIVTMVTLIYVVKGYRQAKKAEEYIGIVLMYRDKSERELNAKIKRKFFTRSEVKGVLSDAHDGDSYKINYFNSQNFIKDVIDVQEGKRNKLRVTISSKDIFDLKEDTKE